MKRLLCCVLIVLAVSCRERYDVPLNTPVSGFLVVEGFINSAGETRVQLSRTTKISERNILPEKNASVQVIGEDNSVFPLIERNEGEYIADQLQLNNTVRYRLNIKTSENKEYVSEYSTVSSTPPIDSLSWIYNSSGVEIYVNAHDPQNNIHYYKWDYEETWEFHSAFRANLTFTTSPGPGPEPIASLAYIDPIRQTIDESIYTCWKTNNSSSINIGSTTKLASDVVYQPIVAYAKGAWELSVLYSIKVKQYALSREAFEFFEKMKKNSENLGSLFDAQPSEIKGNITCVTNPAEPVIGYVEISSAQEKRIFIDNSQLPDWNYDQNCGPSLRAVSNNQDSIQSSYVRHLLPTVPFKLNLRGDIISFNAAPELCVDCRLRGTNQKPSFWP